MAKQGRAHTRPWRPGYCRAPGMQGMAGQGVHAAAALRLLLRDGLADILLDEFILLRRLRHEASEAMHAGGTCGDTEHKKARRRGGHRQTLIKTGVCVQVSRSVRHPTMPAVSACCMACVRPRCAPRRRRPLWMGERGHCLVRPEDALLYDKGGEGTPLRYHEKGVGKTAHFTREHTIFRDLQL